MQMDC
ncbi:hypothetical protein Pint_27308 [Pistacia integerrima]